MRTHTPTITTVIPTYRRPILLRRAIRSVLNQTYRDLRVAVYDNASGDETAAVVAALARDDPRVTYYCHPENIGSSANFAYGMMHVETPYFSMLSDDDFYFPTFFETAMAGFMHHPDIMFAAGASVTMHDNGQIVSCSTAAGYFTPPEGFLQWQHGDGPTTTAMVFRKEIVACIGLLDERIYHSDIDYIWRIATRCSFVMSNKPAMVYVMHAEQGTRHDTIARSLASYLAIRERVHATPNIPAHVVQEADRYLSATFSSMIFYPGLRAIADGAYDRALQAAWMLRTHFGLRRQATLTHTLARMCERFPPSRWPIGILLLAMRRAVTSLAAARRDRAYGPLRTQIRRLRTNLSAPPPSTAGLRS